MSIVFLFLMWSLGEICILPITNATTNWDELYLYTNLIPLSIMNLSSFFILETPL